MGQVAKPDVDSSDTKRNGAAQRAHATRERLLQATITCLARSGYQTMSTNEVVREADASRGALAHHFPTKNALLQAAVERIISDASATFQARMEAIPDAERQLTDAADVLWSFYEDPAIAALIEMMVAARTDPELRGALETVPERMVRTALVAFRDTFPDVAHRPFTEPAIRAIVALYTGLTVNIGADGDRDGRHRQLRQTLNQFLAAVNRTPYPDSSPAKNIRFTGP
jgi:AcrR family transcriptional regulator